MNAELINPFVQSIKNTFRVMCDLYVRIAAPEVKVNDGDAYDISGHIAFSGSATGGVTLCFQFQDAANIAKIFSRSAT